MTDDDPRLAAIRANADMAIGEFKKLSGPDFNVDRGSVAWVEAYIERLRLAETKPDGKIVSVFGCYLGQAIIAAASGATWDDRPDKGIGVLFANGDGCFPFAKVSKQFENGLAGGDGILSFYDLSVDFVAKGKLGDLQANATGRSGS